MKGIYIYSTSDKDYKSSGESKKVLSQVKAFEENGVEIIFLDVILSLKIHKVLYRLPVFGVYSRKIIKKCAKEVPSADFVYIRKNIFDSSYYKLLRKIKKLNPSIKIIVEIPTYPYFLEWNRLIDKPLIWKEKRVIPLVAKNKLVDYYATLTDDDYIFEIPTIKFDNCVSVNNYTPKRNLHTKDEINLIGVALLAFWHGYDRLIKGLYEYYKNNVNPKKVYFHIVGEGTEKNSLKSLVNKCDLSEYVIFEGRLKGDELDHIYDKSNIGIGSLGMFRQNLIYGRSLKAREYCAKGIPFVKAGRDPSFDNFEYCLTVPNDESPIDIEKIVHFSGKIDYEKAVCEMREYAAKNLSWSSFVNAIISKVESLDEDKK